jgi:hypothetical protein
MNLVVNRILRSAIVLGSGCILGAFAGAIAGMILMRKGDNPAMGVLAILLVGFGGAIGALVAACWSALIDYRRRRSTGPTTSHWPPTTSHCSSRLSGSGSGPARSKLRSRRRLPRNSIASGMWSGGCQLVSKLIDRSLALRGHRSRGRSCSLPSACFYVSS